MSVGMLHIVCPRCGKSGNVPESYAGRDIHCKKCDAHFIVGGASRGPAHVEPHGQTSSPAAVAHAHAQTGPTAAAHDHFAPGPPPSAPATPPPPAGPSLMDVLRDSVPDTPPPPAGPSLADMLLDSAELSPLSDDDELHARQRYEARVLSKDRVSHYDDHGNLLTEAEYEARKRQGRSSVH